VLNSGEADGIAKPAILQPGSCAERKRGWKRRKWRLTQIRDGLSLWNDSGGQCCGACVITEKPCSADRTTSGVKDAAASAASEQIERR